MRSAKSIYYLIVPGLIAFILFGCTGQTNATPTPLLEKASSIPAATAAPSDTAVPPTLTPTATVIPPTFTASPTLEPTATTQPSATPTDTPLPPTPSGDQAIYIYLIQTGTGGPIACGDSLIKINTGRPRTGDVAADVATALRSLLVKSPTISGFYNPVYLSNMSVSSVEYKPATKSVTVNLSGTYVRSGDRCDDGRVHDQIWTTIRQFPETKSSPLVLLNGNLLGDILSTAPGRENPKNKP